MDLYSYSRKPKWQRVSDMVAPGYWDLMSMTINAAFPGAKSSYDKELLYWTSPRGEYEIRSTLYAIPFLGDLLRHNEHMQEMDEALELYGLDYEDIKYPGKTVGSGNSSVSRGINYWSSNVGELYR